MDNSEELCRWCDSEFKTRNNHCDDCYPIWREEYKASKRFKQRSIDRGDALRYETLFKLEMIFQGYKETINYDFV